MRAGLAVRKQDLIELVRSYHRERRGGIWVQACAQQRVVAVRDEMHSGLNTAQETTHERHLQAHSCRGPKITAGKGAVAFGCRLERMYSTLSSPIHACFLDCALACLLGEHHKFPDIPSNSTVPLDYPQPEQHRRVLGNSTYQTAHNAQFCAPVSTPSRVASVRW